MFLYCSDFRNKTNNFTTNNVGYERAIHMDDGDSPNVASDIDSQVTKHIPGVIF